MNILIVMILVNLDINVVLMLRILYLTIFIEDSKHQVLKFKKRFKRKLKPKVMLLLT